jgi:hypothetical protein
MKKVEALRDLLVGAVPGLRANPENLSLFVAKGKIGMIRSTTLSFEYRFTATIVVQDYAGDLDLIFLPLLAWVAENQPELLRRQDAEPFTFEVDLLDQETRDVEISIELIERVKVEQQGEDWAVTHLSDEPLRDTLDGVPEGVRISTLILQDMKSGERLVLPE